MARSYRRRRYVRKRRNYGRRRYGMKRRYYGKRNYGRRKGSQRLVRKRYPANNPFGDTVQIKFRFNLGGFLSGGGNDYVFTTIDFNDLAAVETAYQAGGNGCAGFDVYPKLFERYRVTGVKSSFTPMITDASLQPSIGFVMGYSDVAITPHSHNVPEQRWCRYKSLNNWSTGGPVKTISSYLSTKKILGGDRSTAVDLDYTGTTNLAAPFYNPPVKGVGMEWGIVSTAGNPYPAGVVAHYKHTITFYVTFWGRRLNDENF